MLRQQSQKLRFVGAAMLIFYSCFFSHSIKLCGLPQSRLAAFPAKMSAFNSRVARLAFLGKISEIWLRFQFVGLKILIWFCLALSQIGWPWKVLLAFWLFFGLFRLKKFPLTENITIPFSRQHIRQLGPTAAFWISDVINIWRMLNLKYIFCVITGNVCTV